MKSWPFLVFVLALIAIRMIWLEFEREAIREDLRDFQRLELRRLDGGTVNLEGAEKMMFMAVLGSKNECLACYASLYPLQRFKDAYGARVVSVIEDTEQSRFFEQYLEHEFRTGWEVWIGANEIREFFGLADEIDYLIVLGEGSKVIGVFPFHDSVQGPLRRSIDFLAQRFEGGF